MAQDSEAASKLAEGLKLLRAGDSESVKKAVGVLREALAAEPTSEEALAALGQAERQLLISLMASGAEGANVAIALMEIATPQLPERAFNEAELKKLVKTGVTDESYGNRFDASMSLARVYGEFAVPYLLPYLASSNTEYKINAHITLMNRIGRDAVLPLSEAVLKGDSNVRLMAAAELGVIGDERSLAALAETLAGDADGNVRTNAARAFEKLAQKFAWAADMTASELYLRLARLYYSGDYRVMAYGDRPLVVWSWAESLIYAPVPRHLYVLKLAEEAAYDALRLDPANAEARALLARILASESLASTAVSARSDDELTARYAAGLATAAGTVASLGWETLNQALADALDQQDRGAAIFILGVLPHIYGGADFTTENPVVLATSDASAGVRLAAAEAVLRFNATRRITAFPDPEGFINLCAVSVGEVIPRHILVIEASDKRRNKMLNELSKAKYIAFDASSGADGIVRALRYVGLDLIIVSGDLGDMDTLAVIRRLKGDDRTKDTPIVVVGTDEQAADETWQNLYKDKAAGLAGIPSGPGLPSEEFLKVVAASFGGDSPGAKDRYARSAKILDALAATDTGNALFNWNALSETLQALLSADVPNDPPVRMNAVRALANLADASSMGTLVAFFGSTGDNGLKAAAGAAIAAICHGSPQTLDDASFNALLKGTQSDDNNVRMAAFAALGSASLTPEQSLEVVRANRPGAARSTDEDGRVWITFTSHPAKAIVYLVPKSDWDDYLEFNPGQDPAQDDEWLKRYEIGKPTNSKRRVPKMTMFQVVFVLGDQRETKKLDPELDDEVEVSFD